ncbi:MAG: putative Holliday junction resolvase [Alteromonas naphthalenivorans]|jgi:putative Holliday junction resolvase
MKIVALDLGDQWVGIAMTDISRILARPHTTVALADLESFLTTLLKDEPISTVVVGYPQTLRGTESEQTKKIVKQKEVLEKKFDSVEWVFWDERLSSKQAQTVGKKGDKYHIHAKAAAVILDAYLARLRFLQL